MKWEREGREEGGIMGEGRRVYSVVVFVRFVSFCVGPGHGVVCLDSQRLGLRLEPGKITLWKRQWTCN